MRHFLCRAAQTRKSSNSVIVRAQSHVMSENLRRARNLKRKKTNNNNNKSPQLALKIPDFKCAREKAQEGGEDRRERKRQKNNSRKSLCNLLQWGNLPTCLCYSGPTASSATFFSSSTKTKNQDIRVNLISQTEEEHVPTFHSYGISL